MKSRWRLAIKTLPFIVIVVIAKYFAHLYDIEFLSLNALFTALVSANIFLIGFYERAQPRLQYKPHPNAQRH